MWGRAGHDRDLQSARMNIWISWALAVAALYVGYKNYGWQGVIFALTLIAFWLLLQYSRVMRIMTTAGKSPIGYVTDARSLALKIRKGQPLVEVLKLTKSLGRLTNESPETYRWSDDNGDGVNIVFVQGRASTWTLERSE
ncbi:hypothetical protein BH09PSE5_BH09PSE5_51170 [soil metagenome]